MEEWRRDRQLGRYAVSNKGRIKNCETGRIMKTSISDRGYESITLSLYGTRYTKPVHRMVAEAFLYGEHYGEDVNHIDGNKLNNHADNLEWCSRQHNIQHAFSIGIKNSNHRKRGVRILETGEEFDSLTDCGKRLGRNRTTIAACLNGKAKTCGGYHLERTDI